MSSNSNHPTDPTVKVIDFKSFKQKQDVNNEVSRSRKPLFVNKDNGRISGTTSGAKSSDHGSDDFGDRLQKIRSSLDRINSLMADLKKLSSSKATTEQLH
jgi:hypothetical protein